MKATTLAFLFFSHFLSFAQWQTPNNTNTVNLNPQNATRNVGIGTTNVAAKLHVVGNTWLNGITSMAGLVYQGNAITFTGSNLDFFTPVQAQYNGGKPILSLSQFGEINFFSSPYLNQNTIYMGWSGDFNHGIRQSNNFGGVSGFDGPVVFGQNGGALGSSTQNQNWTTNGTKVALSWNNDNVVKIHKSLQFADGTLQTTAGQNVTYNASNNYYTYEGNVNIPGLLKIGNNSLYLGGVSNGTPGTSNEIYTDGSALEIQSKTASIYNQNTIINSGNTGRVGIGTTALTEKLNIDGNLKFASANTGVVFNDGSSLKSSQGIVKNGDSYISFGEVVQITGDNPMLKIGGLVLQDFSTFSSSFATGYPSTISKPEAFVFGNIFWDEIKQKYVSIFNKDIIKYGPNSSNPTRPISTETTTEGGTAIRFNTEDGNLEFLAVPKDIPAGPSGGFEITKAELISNVRMVISANGNIGIGKAVPADKLDINGNLKTSSATITNLSGTGTRMVVADESGNINSQAITWNENVIQQTPTKIVTLYSALQNTNEVTSFKSECTNKKGTLNTQTDGYQNTYTCFLPDFNCVNLANATAKVGIGVELPTEKLEVNGNMKVTGNQSISGDQLVTGRLTLGRVPTNTTNDYKLSVDGKIIATELNLSLGYWPDDVFNANYTLKSLKEIDTYIQKNKHLPEVPSANEMTKKGLNTAQMLQIQMKKIEELTLYLIQQNKEIELLKSKLTSK